MQLARRLAVEGPQLLARSLSSSHSLEDGSFNYVLPWSQHTKPFSERESFLNRTVGLFFLRRIAGSHGYSFSVSEFMEGVREAVFSLAAVVSSPDKQNSLQTILHPRLFERVRYSLDQFPEGARMHLDVESIRQLQLSSVNSVLGATEPGDEHIFDWLGQRVIASRSELRAMDEIDAKFTFQSGRELAVEAASTHMEFQLGVSFKTKEKFGVLDRSGELVEGSNQFRDCYHMWRFCSTVEWSGDIDYPFSWTILDINNYLSQHNR